MRLAELVATSRSVAETSGRLQKIEHLAALLKRVPPEEIETAIAFLSGSTRQGRIGVGSAAIAEAQAAARAADSPSLQLGEVDSAFEAAASVSGAGSAAARSRILASLLARATRDEQDFLVRLLFGELRQGALEGVVLEAVARASGLPAAQVRRAVMLVGDLAPVARAALVEGAPALDALILRPFRPVQPMLAGSAPGTSDAVTQLGEALLEYKLDGARIQVHKVEDEVRVYSRNLRDVTAAVPEVVESALALPARQLILDGETLAIRPGGAPHPFQVTMRRFGRRLDVAELRRTLPLAAFYFDCLYLDGDPLIDAPLSRRVRVLDEIAPESIRVPKLVTAVEDEAAGFLERARAAGHEGVMAKALGAPYAAGARGQAWLKVKPARTLDLVVLAVEWGSGRRRGTLSNLHLGARDEECGGFVMLGKTFKGLTDAMLAWQTGRLLALEIGREGHIVHVRPELVVEIAFNDIQESPHYPGRLALRFARVKRHRTDKTSAEADTFASVQQIYREMTGLEPPPR
jgi:DNA ligase-1